MQLSELNLCGVLRENSLVKFQKVSETFRKFQKKFRKFHKRSESFRKFQEISESLQRISRINGEDSKDWKKMETISKTVTRNLEMKKISKN